MEIVTIYNNSIRCMPRNHYHLLSFNICYILRLYGRVLRSCMEGRPSVTRHAKMRRFSKIMVGRFIGYVDRADSDGNNDTSILFMY